MTHSAYPQIPLGIQLPSELDFDSYFAGPNAEALAQVKRLADHRGEPFLFLWGAAETGKSHLLQAACRWASEHFGPAAYVPLGQAAQLQPAMLDNLEHTTLVCLDDVQNISGDDRWEEALFDLFNRVREAEGWLLAAADANPEHLPLRLADLRSRLGWGPCYHLHPLDDGQRLALIVHLAEQRGLALDADAARYLLSRSQRDTGALDALLKRLDDASLAAQRRLTIPFIRQVLSEKRT